MENPAERNSFFSGLRLELPYLIDALGSGHGFFHQPEQLHFLNEILADHLRHRAEPPSTFLAVGCDHGLDAYSLAITCLETARVHGPFAFSILATDFLPDNVQRARRGVYPARSVDHLPRELVARYFLRSRSATKAEVRLRPGVRARLNFRCQDIFERFSLREPMDVILCRQIVHHFEPRLQKALVQRLRGYLAPGGLLVLGSDITEERGWKRIGPAIYQAR